MAAHKQQQAGHYKGRHRDTDGTNHPQRTVCRRPPVIGRQTPQWNADNDCPGQRHHAHLCRYREHVLDNVNDRIVFLHLDGCPEVQFQQVSQILGQLNRYRLIQSVLFIQSINDALRRRFFRQPWVAGYGVHQEKGNTRYNQHRDRRHDDTLNHKLCHFFTSHSDSFVPIISF